MQAHGLILYMAFGEVSLSHRIKDPRAHSTASKQFFFWEDCRAFNAAQTGLEGVWNGV